MLNVKHLLSFSHRTPGLAAGPPGAPHRARRKAPHAISSNKEYNAGEIKFSADLFNLVISEHLVLAVMGEWAASRRFISRFSRIFVGLLNQRESLSCLPYKYESRIIKPQGKGCDSTVFSGSKGSREQEGVVHPGSPPKTINRTCQGDTGAAKGHTEPARWNTRDGRCGPIHTLTGSLALSYCVPATLLYSGQPAGNGTGQGSALTELTV